MLGRLADQRHVVIDDQDSQALRRDPLEQFMKLELFGRVQTGRGFVEQQQGRIGGERARNLDQPLMAVREARDQFVGAAAEADEGQRLHRALGQRGVTARADHRVAGTLGADLDVFQRRHRAEQADILERPSQSRRGALMRRHVGDVGAIEHDLARCRLVETRQHVERRGLARTIRPDQRMNAAAPHLDVDAIDGLEAAEIFRRAR